MLPSLPPSSSLLPERHRALFAALSACGWGRRPGALVAPNGTFWIPIAPLDLMRLRNHVASRRDRVFRQRRAYFSHADFRAAYDDLDTLLGALEQLSDDGGLDRFFAPLARPLEQLAAQLRLSIIRYEDGQATWRLRGTHPATGRITVFVRKADRDSVFVSALWSYAMGGVNDGTIGLPEQRVNSQRLPRDGAITADFARSAFEELSHRSPHHEAA